MNDGGRSFPSETLSVGVARDSKGTVMVVNNFTRVSGPDWFDSGKMAGFYDNKDHGVPYMEQINYLGSQFEFRRHLQWRDDDAPGFGACRSNHETENIAGNTFNYPAIHGKAIMKAGYSFVSTSVKAVEKNPWTSMRLQASSTSSWASRRRFPQGVAPSLHASRPLPPS